MNLLYERILCAEERQKSKVAGSSDGDVVADWQKSRKEEEESRAAAA